MKQQTNEWFAARVAKVTASRVADVVAKTKSGPAASRANYMAELMIERLTGQRQETFTNAAMERGTELEPLARAAYEAQTGAIVEEVGFIQHPTIEMAGASPDGLVGSDGLIEIKVPNSSTHIENILSGKPSQRYLCQMMFQMACTGRAWCDFVSYDPRFPEGMQLFVVRVLRDDVMVKSLETEVIQFLAELDEQINQLKKKVA